MMQASRCGACHDDALEARLAVERIGDSCGWGVPKYEYVGDRETYFKYADSLTDEEMREAQRASNLTSIDGLPSLKEPSV